jgi:ribosomal protein S18 acetylase RimI-like enzyme
MNFKNPYIQIAERTDIPLIEVLLNSAYRGESSKHGWTTEAHLIAGDVRANKEVINKVWDTAGSVFLKYISNENEFAGCVNLQKIVNKIYLGMFAVSPDKQGSGIGKKMLEAAELYAKEKNCVAIFMSVISLRTELIEWYKRHGYIDTGEKKAFDEDGISGTHLQVLEFSILEKAIK